MDNLETDWAYLAGLIDGEGCIVIGKSGQNKSHDGIPGSIHYSVRIRIGNTKCLMLEWIIVTIGLGRISKTVRHYENINYSDLYEWAVAKQSDVETILLHVMPYLTIKRPQAEIALKYIYLDATWAKEERKELHEKIKLLNRRGPIYELRENTN